MPVVSTSQTLHIVVGDVREPEAIIGQWQKWFLLDLAEHLHLSHLREKGRQYRDTESITSSTRLHSEGWLALLVWHDLSRAEVTISSLRNFSSHEAAAKCLCSLRAHRLIKRVTL